MILWRVRGKIIGSVLCTIVCKLRTVQNTHIWTGLTVVCWLVLAFLWLYRVLQFICVSFCFLGLINVNSLFVCMCVCFCCVRFSFFSTMPRDWLERTSPKWPILCRVGRETLTQSVNPVLVDKTIAYDTGWLLAWKIWQVRELQKDQGNVRETYGSCKIALVKVQCLDWTGVT